MFCTNCGKQVDDSARFCPSCGAPVTRAVEEPVKAAAEVVEAAVEKPAEVATAAIEEPVKAAAATVVEEPKLTLEEIVAKYDTDAPKPAPQAEAPASASPYAAAIHAAPTAPAATAVSQQVPVAAPQQVAYSPIPAAQPAKSQPIQYLQAAQAGLGMKWYKFLIYAGLFLSALSAVVAAIMVFTGSHYMVDGSSYADLVYLFYPSMKAIDIIYGILCLAMAVFAIFVRFQLAAWKKQAPQLLLYYLIAVPIVVLIYVVAASVALGSFAGDASSIAQIIGNVVLIVLNKIYFDKRKHLFTK